MKSFVTIAIVAAFAVASLGAADAAAKRKRHKAMVHHPAGLYVPRASSPARTPGPPWAGPGECYTDEGYGRYWPCDGGKGD